MLPVVTIWNSETIINFLNIEVKTRSKKSLVRKEIPNGMSHPTHHYPS